MLVTDVSGRVGYNLILKLVANKSLNHGNAKIGVGYTFKP